MTLDLTAFAAEYLDDAASLAAYLEDALDDGDAGEFLEALGVVARAKGMSELARDAGIEASGHPDFVTVVAVMKSLGINIRVAPIEAKP